MIVLTSMSDIRTKLLLGTSIGALAMVFAMAAGVEALNTESAIAFEPGQMMGHATVLAVHPDGSMSYAQGDNVLNNPGIDQAMVQLFSQAGTAFDCITMGTGAGTGSTMNSALATTGSTCDNTGTVSNIQTAAANAGVGSVDIVVEFAGLQAGDLTAGAVTITEVTLNDGGGVVLSHTGVGPIEGVIGTIVTITYTMDLS